MFIDKNNIESTLCSYDLFILFAGQCMPCARSFAATPAIAGGKTGSGGAEMDYSSPDHGFEDYRIERKPGDPTRREFTYFMLGGGRLIYASVARLAAIRVSIHSIENIMHVCACTELVVFLIICSSFSYVFFIVCSCIYSIYVYIVCCINESSCRCLGFSIC